MHSRDLAASLDVPIAPGTRVSSSDDVRAFVHTVGFPVMIKALDGGGGRGIRVVESADRVEEAFKRCFPLTMVCHVEQSFTFTSSSGVWGKVPLSNFSSRKRSLVLAGNTSKSRSLVMGLVKSCTFGSESVASKEGGSSCISLLSYSVNSWI